MQPPLRVIHDEAAIAARVRALAAEVDAAAPAGDVHVVGLLKGAFVFVADLIRELARLGRDSRVTFLRASHYDRGRDATGRVELGSAEPPPAGVTLLLADDILDSGHTLLAARRLVSAWRPGWLASCVLLDKPSGRRVAVEAEFVGFRVPAAWVVGYGLDLAGGLRGLPYLALLEEERAPDA